jgi:hypothetical protein
MAWKARGIQRRLLTKQAFGKLDEFEVRHLVDDAGDGALAMAGGSHQSHHAAVIIDLFTRLAGYGRQLDDRRRLVERGDRVRDCSQPAATVLVVRLFL